ncbi:MAG: hypothetical protein LBQ44_08190 [Treponema sp.]|jgi:hypothetical protein|nr:hypothetical protein [Treponema sp.]
MKALLFGLILLAAAGFGVYFWGDQVLVFLRGGLPVAALLIGLLALFIGIADLKDRAAAKKEEEEKAE